RIHRLTIRSRVLAGRHSGRTPERLTIDSNTVAQPSTKLPNSESRALCRFLVQVDLVAIQILERYSGTIRLNLRLAVKLNAGILHTAILTQTIIGYDPQEGLRPALPAD